MAGTPDVILSVGGDLSPLLRQLRGLDKANKFNFSINDRASTLALGRIKAGADQVTSSIEAANQRVIAFGASALVIGSTIRAFNELVKSTIQVERTFIEINSVFTLSAKSLDQFSKSLFDVARQTGQSFEVAGKAALEFSRQGLTVEQTLIRTRDALTLTRQSGLDAAKSVEALTAAVNGFSQESLNTTQIVNKLVAVDTRFAVSSADLAEALSRVGSTAQDAGLGLDQLIGLVTSAQQITARGGAVIGNAFKTIFTRLGRTDTLDQLENLGIVVRDLQGNALSADRVLQNLAGTFDTLTEAQKQQVSELSAGIFQINQFRSILADLGRSYNVFTQATAASSVATNEAAKRNEVLNKTLATLLQNTKTTATEIGSIFGNLTFAEPLKKALTFLNDNSVVDYLKNLSNSPETATVGEQIGQGILKGIGNILTGPALPFLLVTLGKVVGKTFSVLKQDIGGLIGSRNEELATIQNIERVLGAANLADQRRFQTAKSVKEQEEIILKILQEQNAIRAAQAGRVNTILQGLSPSTKKQVNVKNAAGGILPSIAAEQNSVRKGVGGASPSAKPVVIPSFNFGGGKKGTIVANTDEYMVPNYANSGGSAIFNKEMVTAMGLPPGARKINAAAGLIPNFANISRKDLANLLKSTKLQSLTYQKKSGEIADYNAAQFRVRRDLLVGAPPPAGVKSWTQFDEQTNSLVLRSLKAGDKEPQFRRFLMEGIKQVRANGEVYDVAANGYVPNFAPMDFERFLVQVDPSYLNSFLDIEKQDPSLAKFIKNVVDARDPAAQKQMSQYLGGQYVQYTPEKFGLGTTSYLDLKSGPKAIRAQIAEVFSRFNMKVPNFAAMTKLYRGIARPSSEISKTEASKSRFPYDADNVSEEKRITDFDSLITYLGRSRLSTRPGTIPFSRNFKTAAEFANAGYAKESDLVENKEEYFSANKYGMGSRIATQAIIESNIKESRIYKDSKVLQKLIKKIGFDKFFSVFKEGKVGIDTRLIKQALSEKSGQRTSSDLATLQALSDYGYEEEVSFFNNVPPNSKFFNIGKGTPYRDNPEQIANGYIPSFNNPIAAAIAREKEASGLPLSQIYLDQSSKVKSSTNPLGLLVANRRDEPVSGSQGINRVLKQGGDPRKAGMANGYVPNFAEFDEARFIAGSEQTDFNQFFVSKSDAGKLRSMFRALRQEGTKSVDEFIRLKGEIEGFARASKLTKESFDEINLKIKSAGNKLASNLTASAQQRINDERLEKDTLRQNAVRARDFEKARAQLPQSNNISPDTSSQDRAAAERIKRAQIDSAFSKQKNLEKQNAEELAKLQIEEQKKLEAKTKARDAQVLKLEINRAVKGRVTSATQTASSQTQSQTASILAGSSKGGLISTLASPPPGVGSNSALLKDPSFRELALKKQVTGLSNNQLEELARSFGGNTGDRNQNILRSRDVLGDRSTFKRGGKTFVDPNVSNAVVNLARSGTLATDFEKNVKKLILAGSALESAYVKAGKTLLDSGGNSKQLSRAQLTYAYSLNQFEKENQERLKLEKQQRRIQEVSFSKQASFNTIQSELSSGKSISELTAKQQSQLKNTLLKETRKELGFEGITGAQQRANPEINKQINERLTQKLNELSFSQNQGNKLFSQLTSASNIFKNPEKLAEQIIKKANIGTDSAQANTLRNQAANLRQQRNNRIGGIGLVASFAAPALAGFIPEGEGGTASGRRNAAISGGLQGAGTGAAIGSFFGPLGTLIGGGLGGIGGGIAGFISKAAKSFEELAASINEVNAANSQQINAVSTYVQLQQQINDAIQSGAPDRQVNGLLQQQSSVLGRVTSSSDRNSLIEAGSDINKLVEVLQRANTRSDTEGRRGDVLGSLFKSKDSGFRAKDIESTAQALAVATDVTSESIKKSLEKFRESIKNDPIKGFESFAKDLGFSANQIAEVSQKLGGNPEQLGLIFTRYLEVTDQFSKDLSKQEAANRRRLVSRDFSRLLRLVSQETAFGAETNLANASSRNRIVGSRESALLGVQTLSSNDRIRRETQLSISSALRDSSLQRDVSIQRSRASILNLAGTNEEVKGSIPNALLTQLSNLNSKKDFETLASQLGNSNVVLKEELTKAVQELTSIDINGQNTVKELANNGRLQEIQNQFAQKNTLLSNGTFNQGNRESLFEARLQSRTISFGRGGEANQIAGLLEQLNFADRIGLPETERSTNLKNALSERSVLTTLSESLSELLGRNVDSSRKAIEEGAKEILSKPGETDTTRVLAERISAGLDRLNFDPQKAIRDLAQGTNLDKLAQSGQINLGDIGLSGALSELKTPLQGIDAKLGENGPLATILKDIEKNRLVAAEQKNQDVLRLEATDLNRKKSSAEEQALNKKLNNTSLEDINKKIPLSSREVINTSLSGTTFRQNIPIIDDNKRLQDFFSKNLKPDATGLDALQKIQSLDAAKPIEGINLTRKQIEEIIKSATPSTPLSKEEFEEQRTLRIQIASLEQALEINTKALAASENKEKAIGVNNLGPFIERSKQKFQSPILNEILNGKGPILTGITPKVSSGQFSPQDLLRPGATGKVTTSSGSTANPFSSFLAENGNRTPDQANITRAQKALEIAKASIKASEKVNITYQDRLNLINEVYKAQLNLAVAERKEFGSFAAGFKSRILQMQDEAANFAQVGAEIASSLENSLGNAFADFAIGAKTGKDAFRDFAISVLSDASRAFASKAVQGLLGSVFGSFGIGANQGGPISRNIGGPIPFANGGTVPAMLTGGEYYFGPRESQMLGKDFLTKMNAGTLETRRYARGGLVQGGSGVKDDVPARLQPGGFVVKRSSVQKYGPDYLSALSAGRVQGRFLGGAILGALLGGGVGYATGGKKGALIGAVGGGLAGGLAQNAGLLKGIGLNSSKAASSYSGFGQSSGLSLSGAKGGLSSVGLDAPEKLGFAARLQNLSNVQKLGLGLGASALLGLGARALTPKDSTEQGQVMTNEEITANRIRLEGEQATEFSNARNQGQFAYLQLNPQGGYSLGQFGGAPATRRFALGGSVDFAKMAQMGSFSRNNGGYIGASMPEIPNFTAGYSTADTKEYSNGGSVTPNIPASPAPVFRADGGFVGAPMASSPMSKEGSASNSVDITVTINNNGTTSAQSKSEGDENGLGNKEFGDGLAQTIKSYVDERLIEQQRNGGLLSKGNKRQ